MSNSINTINVNTELITPGETLNPTDLDAEWTKLTYRRTSPSNSQSNNAASNRQFTDSSAELITKLNIANSKRNTSISSLIDLHEKIVKSNNP